MARLARIVVPDCPHHIVQRGNRRQNVFFNENDRHFYLETLNENAKKYGIVFWAYCLMSNHVHFIAVPKNEDSFARGLGQAHKKYSRYINKREGWTGHLWQSRFLSFPLNEAYLYAAVRYVENNPVRAGIVDRAEDFAWSSARVHIAGEGGEYETLVLDGPIFRRSINIEYEKIWEEDSGFIKITKAELI